MYSQSAGIALAIFPIDLPVAIVIHPIAAVLVGVGVHVAVIGIAVVVAVEAIVIDVALTVVEIHVPITILVEATVAFFNRAARPNSTGGECSCPEGAMLTRRRW